MLLSCSTTGAIVAGTLGGAANAIGHATSSQQPSPPQQSNTLNCFTKQALPQAFGSNGQIQNTGVLNNGNPIGGHENFLFQATFNPESQEVRLGSGDIDFGSDYRPLPCRSCRRGHHKTHPLSHPLPLVPLWSAPLLYSLFP